jgi:hypothetical protein
MTVAATIEIGTGGTASPGLGKAQGMAEGAGRTGAAAQSSSGSIASGVASFRSNWQSLLASLGAPEGLSQADVEADQGNTFTGQVTEGSAGKASAAASAPAAGAGFLLKQNAEAGSEETSALGVVSRADARAGASVALSAAEVTKSASTGTEKKEESGALETKSYHSARSALTAKAAKTAVAAVAPLPGLVPAALASCPQAAPVAAVSSDALGTGERAQSAQTSLSAGLFLNSPTGFAAASSGSHPLASEQRGEVGGPVNAAAQEAVGGIETRTMRGEVSTMNSASGISSLTPGEAESSVAGEGAPSPGAMLAGNGNAQETPASISSRTQPVAPNPNLATTPVSVQNALLPFAQDEKLIQPLPSETSRPETLAASQALPQMRTQSQSVIPMPVNQGVNVLPASAGSEGLNALPIASIPTASQSGQLSPAAAILDQPVSTGGGKSTTSDKLRSARGNENVDSAQHESRLLQGQSAGPVSAGPVVDAFAMAHALSGAHGAANAAGGAGTGNLAAMPTGPDSRETFATLDAGGATGKPTWIHASAHQAEAGFQDPALGWVSVRADSSGGGVHAALVPSSADAAQALGSHMAGLNAYLAEHHTPVESLTLASSGSGWSGASSGQGAGQGMQQGTGQQSGQETAQSADAGSRFTPLSDRTISTAAVPALPAWSGGLDGGAQSASAGGSHISVMA